MDRRKFIGAASGSLLAACTTPPVAAPVALAPRQSVARSTGLAGPVRNRILVLVELQGGNDGLNTVIPIGDPAYRRLRPGLAIDAQEAAQRSTWFPTSPSIPL